MKKTNFCQFTKRQINLSITLEEALELFEKPRLPREIGFFEDKPVIIGAGKLSLCKA
jgi:DNA topoisomerase-1